METSIIYEMLNDYKLQDYREELEKEDDNFRKYEREDKEKLEQALNEEQCKLLKSYLHSLAMLEEYIDFQMGVRTLNFGIKIGVQLQHSVKDLYKDFDELNEYD